MNCSFFWRVKWLGRGMCCFSENHGGVNLLNGENCCCSRINPFQQHLLNLAEIFNNKYKIEVKISAWKYMQKYLIFFFLLN